MRQRQETQEVLWRMKRVSYAPVLIKTLSGHLDYVSDASLGPESQDALGRADRPDCGKH
jgi:hypothetical protein